FLMPTLLPSCTTPSPYTTLFRSLELLRHRTERTGQAVVLPYVVDVVEHRDERLDRVLDPAPTLSERFGAGPLDEVVEPLVQVVQVRLRPGELVLQVGSLGLGRGHRILLGGCALRPGTPTRGGARGRAAPAVTGCLSR